MFNVLFRVFLLVVIPLLVGCSSTLTRVQRESSLDKMEITNGQMPGEGSHTKRGLDLAADEIYNRPIDAKAHQGYLVLLVNYSYGIKTFKVWRDKAWWEVFGEPTLVAKFVISDGGQQEWRFMPGRYLVGCWEGNRYIASQWYEVTTAPAVTDMQTPSGKNRYHDIWGYQSGCNYSR